MRGVGTVSTLAASDQADAGFLGFSGPDTNPNSLKP